MQNAFAPFQNRRRPTRASTLESVLPFKKSTGYGLRSLSATLKTAERAHSGSLVAPASRQSSERLGSSTETASDSIAIRQQKQRREKRKEQLGRRRQRFVQECEHYHSDLGSVRATVALETLVVRETKSEQRVREEIENVIVYKEVARENRAMRNAAYAEQRRVDAEAAIDRDASSYGKLVLRYEDDTETQLLQQQQHETAKQAAAKHEHKQIASVLMRDVMEFVLFVAGKREETLYARSPAVFLPEATWTEFKVQFAHGIQLSYANDCGACSPDAALKVGASGDGSDTRHQEQDDDGSILSRYQLGEYLASFLPIGREVDYVGSAASSGTTLSPWCPPDAKFIGAVSLLDSCVVLGEEVKYVRWIHATTPTAGAVDALSASPSAEPIVGEGAQLNSEAGAAESDSNVGVQVGEIVTDDSPSEAALREDEPLSGHPAASSSEGNCSLAVIPPKLLRILVFNSPFAGKKTHTQRLAERYDLELLSAHQLLDEALSSDVSSSSNDSSTDLGAEARQLLTSGAEIPPGIYSRLILDAVGALERRIAVSTSTEPAAAALGAEQPSRHVRGWIVIDLPGTAEQARDFEEQLSGFIDPAHVASPFDHESSIASGVAKPELPPTFLHGKSGVDLAFYLSSACEAALERCLGQLEDSATHAAFHLVSNAPPVDSTERHRLAHANASNLNCSELLSLQCVTSEGFEEAPRRWYEAFATLREVDTTHADADETHAQLAAFVDAYFQQQEDATQAAQWEREATECDRMVAEEHRQCQVHEWETAIVAAREEHTQCLQVLQQAEEAKAKKEELAEHRQAVETAQKRVDAAVNVALVAAGKEKQRSAQAAAVYSAQLTPPLCSLLARVWDDLEREYRSVMLRAFDQQREQRQRTASRASVVIDDVCAFVRRPDAKQMHVNEFQQRFNDVVDEMRFDDATKVELHARTDLLQDELALVVAAKTAANDEELDSVLADGWLEDTCQCLAVVFQAALQTECDRFLVSFQLLVEGYAAASSTPSALAPALDNLKLHHSLQDVSCRLFFDASAVVDDPPAAPAVPPPPTTSGKSSGGAAKGKGKAAASAPAAAAAIAPSVAKDNDATKDEHGDPMSAVDLLASYDRALQKCDAIVQLVTSKVSVDDASDTSVKNLLRGIQYEHDLVQRRVRFLREAAQSACEHVTRAMRAVETTLREVIRERKEREEAAVAALVTFVRSAIEAEVGLPHFINVQVGRLGVPDGCVDVVWRIMRLTD